MSYPDLCVAILNKALVDAQYKQDKTDVVHFANSRYCELYCDIGGVDVEFYKDSLRRVLDGKLVLNDTKLTAYEDKRISNLILLLLKKHKRKSKEFIRSKVGVKSILTINPIFERLVAENKIIKNGRFFEIKE